MIPESLMAPPDARSVIRLGRVTSLSKQNVEVALDGEIFQAVRSMGCMVEPRAGDRVVVFLPEGYAPVILSIVDSKNAADTSSRTMRFPEGLVMEVSGRPFTLRAHDGIAIESPRDTHIRGGRFSGHFSELSVEADQMTFMGGILSFVGQKIEQVAQILERVAEWLNDRAHGSNREIETIDRQSTGQMLIQSESIVSIQSKTTLLSSPDLVKVDSDQVHLG